MEEWKMYINYDVAIIVNANSSLSNLSPGKKYAICLMSPIGHVGKLHFS